MTYFLSLNTKGDITQSQSPFTFIAFSYNESEWLLRLNSLKPLCFVEERQTCLQQHEYNDRLWCYVLVQ